MKTDLPPCVLAIHSSGVCQRCGARRALNGDPVHSVKCYEWMNGPEHRLPVDLERWHRLGLAHLPRVEEPK